MELLDALRQSRKEHWKDAWYWLFLNFIGSLFPSWGLLFVLALLNQPFNLETFSERGEFALYSTAMISASYYLVSRRSNGIFVRPIIRRLKSGQITSGQREGFPGSRIFLGLSLLGILVSGVAFSIATLAHFPKVELSLNVQLLIWSTLAVFFMALLINFLSTVIDNSLSDYNPIAARDDQYKKLNDDFDKTS